MIGANTLPRAYAAPGLIMRDDAGVLADVMMDPVQVTVWDRRSPINQRLVQQACLKKLAVKSWLDVNDLSGSIERLLPGEDFAPLREDLMLLADMMACLFGVSGVGVRVTALEKPMCPRFHVDRIPVRLLCTYGGPGSQWLPAPSVPAGLLVPGVEQEGRYAADSVQQLQAGQVALFKGDTWRDNPGSGVVHRSPPVSPGQQRLLVTLDI
ncbi:MAG: DUF1826 domain-containing protein [Alcanivorax jadensis]|uniref:DUF1826 domain-containing protein n=1 Tax=Alcanivorax jadensis TaxID=64988 RepID=UPI003002BCC7